MIQIVPEVLDPYFDMYEHKLRVEVELILSHCIPYQRITFDLEMYTERGLLQYSLENLEMRMILYIDIELEMFLQRKRIEVPF